MFKICPSVVPSDTNKFCQFFPVTSDKNHLIIGVKPQLVDPYPDHKTLQCLLLVYQLIHFLTLMVKCKIFRQLNFGRQRQLINSLLSHLTILHLYTPTSSLPTLHFINIISQYKKWIDDRDQSISVNIRSHFTRFVI